MSDKPFDPATIPPLLRELFDVARVLDRIRWRQERRLNQAKAAEQEARKG